MRGGPLGAKKRPGYTRLTGASLMRGPETRLATVSPAHTSQTRSWRSRSDPENTGKNTNWLRRLRPTWGSVPKPAPWVEPRDSCRSTQTSTLNGPSACSPEGPLEDPSHRFRWIWARKRLDTGIDSSVRRPLSTTPTKPPLLGFVGAGAGWHQGVSGRAPSSGPKGLISPLPSAEVSAKGQVFWRSADAAVDQNTWQLLSSLIVHLSPRDGRQAGDRVLSALPRAHPVHRQGQSLVPLTPVMLRQMADCTTGVLHFIPPY